jgi:FMN-dependent NADH-azoreductase
MHVDASPKRERSNSRALSRHFVDLLRERGVADLEVDYLDVALDPPPHPTECFAVAAYTPPDERTPEMAASLKVSDDLCRRLLAADALVFAMPMHNFTIPSAFKAFVDNIVRGGLTYVAAPGGRYAGQVSRQKVLFITSRGADLRPGSPLARMDALTPALRAAFGFIGVAEPRFVDAQPLQFADQEARAAALARARADLAAVAAEWAAPGPGAGSRATASGAPVPPEPERTQPRA